MISLIRTGISGVLKGTKERDSTDWGSKKVDFKLESLVKNGGIKTLLTAIFYKSILFDYLSKGSTLPLNNIGLNALFSYSLNSFKLTLQNILVEIEFGPRFIDLGYSKSSSLCKSKGLLEHQMN